MEEKGREGKIAIRTDLSREKAIKARFDETAWKIKVKSQEEGEGKEAAAAEKAKTLTGGKKQKK